MSKKLREMRNEIRASLGKLTELAGNESFYPEGVKRSWHSEGKKPEKLEYLCTLYENATVCSTVAFRGEWEVYPGIVSSLDYRKWEIYHGIFIQTLTHHHSGGVQVGRVERWYIVEDKDTERRLEELAVLEKKVKEVEEAVSHISCREEVRRVWRDIENLHARSWDPQNEINLLLGWSGKGTSPAYHCDPTRIWKFVVVERLVLANAVTPQEVEANLKGWVPSKYPEFLNLLKEDWETKDWKESVAFFQH